jgi:outer membrane protein OmpA-like peptidoglycan-associated protein
VKLFKRASSDNEWIGISDIMSGVMMVFLFLAVLFMLANEKEKQNIESEKSRVEKLADSYLLTQNSIKEIVLTYRESQKSLNIDLHNEFDRDFKRWGAEITDDNRIRFQSPHILFQAGSSEVSSHFKNILKELFPRYIEIVTSPKYRDEINEIRVEGHTSYGWGRSKNEEYIYMKNMELSQRRAWAVLKYCYSLSATEDRKNWITSKFRANGMAYSQPIYREDGLIDRERSRRVELIVTTKATEKIYKIIEELD